MSAVETLTWIETLAGFALFLQNMEWLWLNRALPPHSFFAFRTRVSVALFLFGCYHLAFPNLPRFFYITGLLDLILLMSGLYLLRFWNGPYNGGSDRMTLLILAICSGARLWPDLRTSELLLAYLSIQVVLSYFIAGVVKLRDPHWRSGQFLVWVFERSFYPVSQLDRKCSRHQVVLRIFAFSALAFELLFPVSLISPWTLASALGLAILFHLGNAWFLGLNRFLWIWLASYPALIWFQHRLTQ